MPGSVRIEPGLVAAGGRDGSLRHLQRRGEDSAVPGIPDGDQPGEVVLPNAGGPDVSSRVDQVAVDAVRFEHRGHRIHDVALGNPV